MSHRRSISSTLAVMLAITLSSACQTPVPRQAFSEIAARLDGVPDGKARLYFFVREKHWSHVAAVKHDGRALVTFTQPFSATAVDVPSGTYELLAYCNAAALGMKDHPLRFTAESGQSRYFEWYWKLGWGGGATLIPIDAQQGQATINQCFFEAPDADVQAALTSAGEKVQKESQGS